MADPVRQHIIPRFYLQRWVPNHQDTLYAYDKQEDRVFEAQPQNVAVKKFFYTDPGSDHELERRLSHLEGGVAPIIGEIIDGESIVGIRGEKKATLDLFLAVQMMRTQESRIRMEQTNRAIMHAFGDQMTDELRAEVEEADPTEMHRDQVESAGRFLESFSWLRPALLLNETTCQFTTSDNPLAFHNMFPPPEPWQGNLGLESFGIEVYLPLSPTHMLVTLDPTPWPDYPGIPGEKMLPTRTKIQELEHVIWHRAQQCTASVRFIYGCEDDFEFERWMVQQHPELQDPNRPRMQSNYMGRDLVREALASKEDLEGAKESPFDRWPGHPY